MVFAPTLGGSRTGVLTFADSAANSPQTLSLSGVGVDFTLTASGPTTITIASGASATFPFLLTSATGTPGTAAFTCLGAPANATCTVTPQNPALGGTTTIAVVIATGVTITSLPPTLRKTFWLATLLPFGLLALRMSRRPTRLLACILSFGVLAVSGCTIGRAIPEASSATGTTGSLTPTPSGSYSIAVSAASAGVTRTVNVTLIVQ